MFVDATGRLWDPNRSSATVTAYAPGANGNAAPVVTLAGPNTGFITPIGVYVTAAATILASDVANAANGSVRTFAPGSNGNVAPTGVLSGSNTTFAAGQATGIWLDAAGNLYVSNFSQASVDVFAPGATGNVAPIRIISGTSTLLASPLALTLDAAGNIYVANPGGANVLVFPPGSNGNVPPSRVISGSNTLLSFPAGIAVDAQGFIYVCDANTSAVLVFAPGARERRARAKHLGQQYRVEQQSGSSAAVG